MNKAIKKTLNLDKLPGGTKLKRPTAILIEFSTDGKTYAAAPELGMWLDGVGNSEDEAIEDLAGLVRRYKESLSYVRDAESYEYLRLMKSAFNDLVIEG